MIGRMRWLENARWLVALGDAPAGLAAILKVLYLVVLADLFHPWPRRPTGKVQRWLSFLWGKSSLYKCNR